MFDLSGKVAIVTGAGRYTGKVIALELAKSGVDVVVIARTQSTIEETANEIRALGRKSLAVPTDVCQESQIDDLMKKTMAQFGRIDILVNNVGVDFLSSALKVSQEQFDDLLRANLSSTFLCSKAAAAIMKEHGGGSIVNISSTEGIQSAVTNVAYAAAKAGVINLTRTLAVEWAKYNIRVNAVAPGYIDTDDLPLALKVPQLKMLFDKIPMKRAGTCREYAGTVIFLCSEAGGYCNGTTIVADGGMTVANR